MKNDGLEGDATIKPLNAMWLGVWVSIAIVAGAVAPQFADLRVSVPDVERLEPLLVICLLSPLIEEFLFRGALQPSFHRLAARILPFAVARLPPLANSPNIVCSLLFVAVHSANGVASGWTLPGLFLASFALGALADRGASLPILVLIHASWNFSMLSSVSPPLPL